MGGSIESWAPAGHWRRATALLLAAVIAWGSAGCGGDATGDADVAQEVVTGVLFDGSAPAAGVELELMVWPAPQGNASAAPELLQVGTATTDDDGRFELEALGGQLSPHATRDGVVGIDVRRVGADEFLARTTVRLTKAQETGVTEVHTAEGLELNLSPHDPADEPGGEGAEGGD